MSETGQSYWSLVEAIYEKVDIYNGSQGFLASIALVPRPLGILYAAHFCLSEVQNGGFLQFFLNSTGVLAPEAIEGFDAIQMPQLAAVVRETIALLGEPYPRDRTERSKALLRTSGRDESDLTQIFKEAKNLYLAYTKATETLPFDALDRRIWDLAESENGGFDQASDRYLQSLSTAL